MQPNLSAEINYGGGGGGDEKSSCTNATTF